MEEFDTGQERFIPLISDYGFKVTFGNETNTLFLRQALQTLLKSTVPITRIIFNKNTVEGYTSDSRSGVYDISCTDEHDNHFIVEMQLSDYPQFLQRMKFYSAFKFNTLVKKGDYSFENLSKVYCVGILKKTIFPSIEDYHNISTLRNEKGEQTDSQLSFITVELDKFRKKAGQVKSDIDKLIYTMKTLHKVKNKKQFPEFWNEEWLKAAIQEVDRSAMSAEKRLAYEMLIAQNAAAVHGEKKKIEAIKKSAVIKSLQKGLDPELVAEINDVTLDFVLNIQRSLSK
ncbi:Rpn family recombination-promoting nuclease/putative transposase [Larkinella sp. GY13]|uniref:Rpn family recombination-promoting nuclease/putative transposase n=1 Tax=Larkinella sp. GY13 TaxID=3453720 RepID=UPI003EE8E889